MIAWLLERIGIESDITSRLEHAEWSFSAPWALWLGLGILVPIGWFIARRHRRSLPQVAPLYRGLLTACRIGVLLVLVIVLSGPQIRVREPAQQKPILALLVDESESMQLPAGPFAPEQAAPMARTAGLWEAAGDASDAAQGDAQTTVPTEIRNQLDSMPRRELVRRVLKAQSPVMRQLSRRCEVRCYRFAQSVVRCSPEEIGLSLDEKASAREEKAVTESSRPPDLGQTTAIGTALQLAVAEASGQPVAGIVIISDGRVTAGPDPRHLVGEDGEVGVVPIWSVPAGTRRDIDDLSLLGVITPQNIALGDRVNIVALLRTPGFSGVQAEVELLDGDEVADRSQITLGSGEEQSVALRFQTKQPGTRLLTVRIEKKPGETVTRNNEQQVTLQVDQQKWRVLYLEGWPRWDFRFLDHAFRRDHGVDVRMVMESQLRERRHRLAEEKKKAESQKPAGDPPRAGTGTAGTGGAEGQPPGEEDKTLPALAAMAELPEDISRMAEYDVLVLGDVSPELLTPQIQEAIVRAVKERAVGLILQAGTEHLPHAYRDTPLGQLVPLDVAASVVGRGGMYAEAFSPFTLAVTDAGFLYPAFRPYDQLANNREIWGRMPDMHWVMDAREIGSATRVLAEVKTLQGRQPLIAERYVGKGRVFLIGTDSTYRWKMNIGDQLFYPFWGRTIRQLAQSRHRQSNPSWIEAYPRRAELGEAVDIEVYAVDKDQAPLAAAQVEVRIETAGKKEPDTITLAGYGEPGWFRGVWSPSSPGDFRLHYADPAGKAASTEVRVAPSGREFLRPSVDWQDFGQLAEASPGGALLPLHEFARLAKLVQGQPTDVVRDYEAQLWDNWLVLLVLAGLYCLDIVVRRLLGLT